MLGKNGEPKPFEKVNLIFNHYLAGKKYTELTTDEAGKVYLGALDMVYTVEVRGQRQWIVPSTTED